MQQESVRHEVSVDSKTAEEALALAVRLQGQQGDRVSFDQLRKTADEAGIDPHYLQEALQRVTETKKTNDLQSRRQRLMLATMMMSFAFAVALAMSLNSGRFAVSHSASAMLIAMFTAMVAVGVIRRLRDR